MANRITSLCIDAPTPGGGRFWSQVLGWPVVEGEDDEVVVRIQDGPDARLAIDFCDGAGRTEDGKNRLHIDVNATDRDQARSSTVCWRSARRRPTSARART